jgi:RNA polymerase sigma factor (sigma-70 family)
MNETLKNGLLQASRKGKNTAFQGRNITLSNNLADRTRPMCVEDMVLPKRLKKRFKGETLDTNYLFYGTSGKGKTTLAYILAKDFYLMDDNFKSERGVAFLENVEKFCLTDRHINGKPKAVLIDEADKLTPTVENGLKTKIESTKVKFIFITNYVNKIDVTLQSRLTSVNFDYTPDENKEVSKELVQETFVAAWQSFDRFEGKSSPVTWLISILKNKAVDHYRRNAKRGRLSFSEIEAIARNCDKKILKEIGLFDVYEGKNLEEGKKSYAVSFVLQDESKTLEEKHRIVFSLRHFEGLSIKEIAEIVESNEGTVKSRLFYATKYLAEKLKAFNPVLNR